MGEALLLRIQQFSDTPCRKIRKFAERPRSRFLQPEELARFFAALANLRYDTSRDAILMMLLTGARRGNVFKMRWDQISFARSIWEIPRTKNGDSQILPLIPDALVILQKRKHASVSPWVFPSETDRAKPIRCIVRAWRSVLAQAGIEDLRIHDLRRSLASYQAINGCNLPVISQTLGHKDVHSTMIYAKLNTAPVRDAICTAVNAMFEAGGLPVNAPEGARVESLSPSFKVSQNDPWVPEEKAAALAGVSVFALQQLRFKNHGPCYLKRGALVFYKPSMVQAWMHERQGLL